MLQISVISCALLPFSFFYFYPPILLGYLEIGQIAKNQKNQSADQPMLQLSTICTKMYCNCTDREYFFFSFFFFCCRYFHLHNINPIYSLQANKQTYLFSYNIFFTISNVFFINSKKLDKCFSFSFFSFLILSLTSSDFKNHNMFNFFFKYQWEQLKKCIDLKYLFFLQIS